MSYAVAAALQQALYTRISEDALVASLVGTNVFDTPPNGAPPATYVALGPEKVRDRSDKTGAGALHELTIAVVTTEAGFATAKTVAAAVCDALDAGLPVLGRGHLVDLNFYRAQARRDDAGQLRRIDLVYRARVQDS